MTSARNGIPHCLHELAETFEQTIQQSAHGPGWGQFLDGARRHEQVGLYGTSAGAMVRSLAGRGMDSTAEQTLRTLQRYWDDRLGDYGAKRFVQTPRLAMMHLAVAMLPRTEEVTSLLEQSRHELLRRQLPSHLWGNWFHERHGDATPRMFPSALALLALAAENFGTEDVMLLDAAQELENRVARAPALPPHVFAASVAAILLCRSSIRDRTVLRRMNTVAWTQSIRLDDQSVYFYDCEYLNPATGQPESARDYLIVPTEALLGIAGFLFGSSTAMRLRAETLLPRVIENVNANHGAFRPTPEERQTTVNQAWVALLLHVAHNAPAHVSRRGQLLYSLLRKREGNRWWSYGFPLVTSAFAVAFATFLTELDLDPPSFNIAAKLIAPVGLLLIGAINGEIVLRRLWGQ